jgi:peptidoglycan/LPS O-acetylase OafA/YrhL
MIQRIQTLYLFGAAIISAVSAFFLPLYQIEGEFFSATAHAGSFGGFGTCMALFSGAILLFNNRNLQLLVVRIGMLVSLFVLGYLIYLINSTGASASWGAIMPFILVVLAFLASKGIQKDEKKVRSLDRLR